MDHRPCTLSDKLLVENPTEQLSFLNAELFIIHVPVGLPQIFVLDSSFCVNWLGDDHTHDLLASPEFPGLQNGRHGQLTRELVIPHHQVHDLGLVQKRVSLSKQATAQQRVLHYTHNGLVGLGSDNLLGHMGQEPQFRNSLVRLGHVHVHLIPIKIGIIRRTHW